VTLAPSCVEDSLAAGSDLLQWMRTRISQLEKDLWNISAIETVIKKKGELVVEAER
jgi:hypothetical protein